MLGAGAGATGEDVGVALAENEPPKGFPREGGLAVGWAAEPPVWVTLDKFLSSHALVPLPGR